MPNATAPTHLSKSQLGALDACSLKYYRRYVLHEKAPMSAKVAAGISLHKAIARYYTAMKAGQPLPSSGELWNVAHAAWEAVDIPLVYAEAPNDKEGLEKDVREALDTFVTGIGPTLKPWGVEVHAPVTLRYGTIEQVMDAYIDLVLDQEGNGYPLIDWKFTQRFAETKEVRADQAVYSMWHSQKFRVAETKFMTVCFVRYKRGIEVKCDTFTVTPEAREFYMKHVIYPRLLQKQAGIWPANTQNCSWCEFHNVTCFPQGAL